MIKKLSVSVLVLAVICLSFKSDSLLIDRSFAATPSGPGIVLKVTPLEKGVAVPNVVIKLRHDTNFVMETQTVKPDGWVKDPQSATFQLEANSHYTIILSKSGYITLVVKVDTRLPAGMNLNAPLQAAADIAMLLESKHPDLKDPDYPLVLLVYDKEKGRFMPDKEYAKSIRIMMQMK
jgi:hypothetical protein